MRVCVHRGAHEIGGSLVELEAEGSRLVLDAGLPLEPGASHLDLLPDVPGLWAEGDGSMLALLISHGHPDHYGLADLVDPAVPIFLGEQAAAILAEASFFVPGMQPFSLGGHLRHRQPLRFGPFVVTPWLVDHSAFDAYALLVEAGGRRLLYTGDVRAHGRKPQTLEALARGAAGADVLLLEGTRIGRDRAARAERTEADVEAACATAFRANDGLALPACGPQGQRATDPRNPAGSLLLRRRGQETRALAARTRRGPRARCGVERRPPRRAQAHSGLGQRARDQRGPRLARRSRTSARAAPEAPRRPPVPPRGNPIVAAALGPARCGGGHS